MIYIYPSEGGRAYLQQVGPSLTRRDLLIVPDTWAKALAHHILDPLFPNRADLPHIRVVGTRKARRYAALAAQESTTGQPVPVFSWAISRERSQPPE